MSDLSWWWPTPQRLHEVLLSDAEAHSRAVALAVHQRMYIRRRHHDEPIDTARSETVDERAILTQNMPPPRFSNDFTRGIVAVLFPCVHVGT